jgi:uncharacterized coiled-coil protein SlyX
MSLEERLDAVERALTDGEYGPADLSEAAAREARLDDADARLDDLEERVAELEAATQALRGYVGTVRSVNREVEETAEAARATADRVERRLDEALPVSGREPMDPDGVDSRAGRPPEADQRVDAGAADRPVHHLDGRSDEPDDRVEERSDGRRDERSDGRRDERSDGRMHERSDGRRDERSDGRKDGRSDEPWDVPAERLVERVRDVL